jgi:hypothetical protein
MPPDSPLPLALVTRMRYDASQRQNYVDPGRVRLPYRG